ncbi:MAG TPA: sigma-E factor negative regulatory protein [Noviherbaspirillum sp.]|uniref:sigma-E factor negative regulatory protein n=1 Tax=Noviherbaspirillum sp. TaxID=1926288 RepID=UPI002B488D42|nr:sigma-E factor negative regulatory protein [Noviherbaspirillum sp.]HJV87032.1 sigma-E factor negative regulatory protein [Noviherbaspirillum sp.]
MKTNEMTRQQISALVDGELAEEQVDPVLAGLRHAEGRADWEIYHQIGDVLRSEDMAVSMSPSFAARMAMRLESEPTIVAPAVPEKHAGFAQADQHSTAKRWTVGSMIAAAAVAAAAFVATPQLMVAIKGNAVAGDDAATVATASVEQNAVVPASASEGVVLRDPRIDDYLLAHQRFSPSVYSTAQYARSATFSNK